MSFQIARTDHPVEQRTDGRYDFVGERFRLTRLVDKPRIVSVIATRRLLDFGDAALGGKLLKLQSVVAGDDAIGVATGKLNHALLILDVSGEIGVGECGAGFVLGEVAVQIAIVGGEDEGRMALDTDILRCKGVPRAGVSANPRK